jgi:endonuclease YncB( thermonuclease family)
MKLGRFALILTVVLIAGLRLIGDDGFEAREGRPVISDGDSLRLSGERVRLLGLDAPELSQTCLLGSSSQPCGLLARQALKKLIGGRKIRCEPQGRDRYGRLLARCYAGGDDIGRMMVARGWAVARGDYRFAQAAARIAGSGIWATTFDDPADWRASHGRDGEPLSFWSRFWN